MAAEAARASQVVKGMTRARDAVEAREKVATIINDDRV
jgi:hypothetical protein